MASLEFFIALRYLKARRKGVFTLLTTLIAIGGITLGVAALIITLSVMSGFHRDIRERILGLQPHLVVLKQSTEPFTEHGQIIARLKEDAEVRAAAPFIYGQIIVRSGNATAGAVVKGVDWKAENALVDLHRMIVQPHALQEGLKDGEIVLGRELAAAIGADVGQDVILMSPGQVAMIPKMERFRVAGIFRSGMYEYDANMAYVTLASGQKLFSLDDAVSGIGASVRHWERANTVGQNVQNLLSYPYLVRSWERMNHNLFAALKLEKIMMFIILTLIILVAAFNIISNLLLLTVEKSKEIGILSALGLSRAQIGRIFLYEGLITGIAGVFSGIVLGLGTALLLKKYQFIRLPADVYYLDTLPVRIVAGDILGVIAATLLITVLAGLYPAYQATKLDPLDAIRYG